jgi:hypothetical protein
VKLDVTKLSSRCTFCDIFLQNTSTISYLYCNICLRDVYIFTYERKYSLIKYTADTYHRCIQRPCMPRK